MFQATLVAPNNVEVRKSRAIETTAKSMVEAFVEPPEVYGQTRLDTELAALQAEKDRINAFDKKAELAKLKEKENMLLAIDTAMKSDTIVEKISPTL